MNSLLNAITDDPITWEPCRTAKDARDVWTWLSKHLNKFDRMFYTDRGRNANRGFQPFIMAYDTPVRVKWLRDLCQHDKTATKAVRLFRIPGDTTQTHEFITWVVPGIGCVTSYIKKNKAVMFSYLSEKELQEQDKTPEQVFSKYIGNMTQCKTAEQCVSLMQMLVLSGA